MLITLAIHQVGTGPHSLSLDGLKNHLLYLNDHFNLVDQPFFDSKTNVLLTFDDATYDFYEFVFPLLVEFKIPALLGVPTGWILEKPESASKNRLALLNSKNPFKNRSAFCSVLELKEMLASPYVTLAAHGHHHKNLKHQPDIQELIQPKQFFLDHFGEVPDTFIFPYGGIHKELILLAQKEYQYLMRLGSSSNYFLPSPYIYRMVINQETSLAPLFSKQHLAKIFCKEIFNRIRLR